MDKSLCLANLLTRNRDAPTPLLDALRAADDPALAPPSVVGLPFMLLQAPGEAEVEVVLAANSKSATLHFGRWDFAVHSDEEILKVCGWVWG